MVVSMIQTLAYQLRCAADQTKYVDVVKLLACLSRYPIDARVVNEALEQVVDRFNIMNYGSIHYMAAFIPEFY